MTTVAGIAKGTLYNHFRTKDAIVEHALVPAERERLDDPLRDE